MSINLGLAFSRNSMQPLKCFWSKVWLGCSLGFCSYFPEILRAWRQCALQCWQMPVSAFREIESSLFIGWWDLNYRERVINKQLCFYYLETGTCWTLPVVWRWWRPSSQGVRRLEYGKNWRMLIETRKITGNWMWIFGINSEILEVRERWMMNKSRYIS